MMGTERAVGRATYAGLFLIALATLMYEILLIRVFSVTMWYHFAFVAVSVAMFGMTVGALAVYLRPAMFPPERVHSNLAWSSLGLAFTIVVSLIIHMSIPYAPPQINSSARPFGRQLSGDFGPFRLQWNHRLPGAHAISPAD